MNLTLKYHSIDEDGRISRSILEDPNHQTFRRFAGTILVSWQERIHTGDYHNILDQSRVDALESAFQALPPATSDQIQDW